MPVTIKENLTDEGKNRLVKFFMILMEIDRELKREKNEKKMLLISREMLVRTLNRIILVRMISDQRIPVYILVCVPLIDNLKMTLNKFYQNIDWQHFLALCDIVR